MIRSGIKRRVGRDVCDRRETKGSDAVVSVSLEVFHDASRCVNAFPMDSIVSGDNDGAAQVGGGSQNFAEKFGLRRIIFLVHQGWADADQNILLFAYGVEVMKKRKCRLFGHSVCVFWKRLSRDADGLHFVAGQ